MNRDDDEDTSLLQKSRANTDKLLKESSDKINKKIDETT